MVYCIYKGGVKMVTRLEINEQVLRYYIEKSNVPIEILQNKEKNIDLFLNGSKSPTFNQLSNIAKTIYIPLGLLLLKDPIEDPIKDIDFRTIDSSNLEGFSPELRDTIREMKVKQDFLREEIEEELEFVGKFSIEDDYMTVANGIREYLNLSENYYKNISKKNFNVLRDKVNEIGVFVFLNGKIKDNTHRPLNLNEFRGFVLSDKKAPIIFINQIDSKNGQIFTLIHELVHLFLNENEIFNIVEHKTYKYNPTEYFANKVTAEILVPSKYVSQTNSDDILELSNKFQVSRFVIARRLYDLKYINKKEYETIITDLQKEAENISDFTKKRSSGGNYNNNIKFRMDKPFVGYIENALASNKITYTEAFSILGVGYKGYKTLIRGKDI